MVTTYGSSAAEIVSAFDFDFNAARVLLESSSRVISIHSLRNRVNDVSSILVNESNLSFARIPTVSTYYYVFAIPEGTCLRVIVLIILLIVLTF